MSLSEPTGESSACSFYAVSAALAHRDREGERARTQRRLKSSNGLNAKKQTDRTLEAFTLRDLNYTKRDYEERRKRERSVSGSETDRNTLIS